ncbi:unnamed protein product [Bursaphelenchus okinawaensis]|uniref:Uncharacterized protein n=1 Tax=Bursaphelenchus okinawaensis TaxID=465554 RepID=A0A811LIY7_9BILA|nr:unnamed protein product [Bursaphelenchus okinawaensis]CAG9124115.1 unnamed protein product [Bursaphelenchus okinawaensis]
MRLYLQFFAVFLILFVVVLEAERANKEGPKRDKQVPGNRPNRHHKNEQKEHKHQPNKKLENKPLPAPQRPVRPYPQKVQQQGPGQNELPPVDGQQPRYQAEETEEGDIRVSVVLKQKKKKKTLTEN